MRLFFNNLNFQAMKKLLFVLCILGAVVTAQAQLKFGAKVGLNFSTLTGDLEDTKVKLGPQFGLFVNYAFSDKVAVQPELLYSMQGCKLDDFTETGGEGKAEINYILVPILVKFYPVSGLSLQAGPQLGFLTTAKIEDEDVKDDAEKVDFGINVGAGYEMESGLGFDLRYNFGLTNINKEDSWGDMKNGVFTIAVSYSF